MNETEYLLDTNIISELMRESPEPLLLEWFENKKDNKFFISAITRAEILLGIELLPESKKKNQLKYTFDLIIEEDFRDQCLAFDENAAVKYAKIIVQRNKLGRPVSVEDAFITAISLANNTTLVTRNEKDFLGIEDLEIINPWKLTQ